MFLRRKDARKTNIRYQTSVGIKTGTQPIYVRRQHKQKLLKEKHKNK